MIKRQYFSKAIRCVALIALMLLPVAMNAQSGAFKVTGTVTGEDGDPLVGVTVMAQDGKTGVSTDIDGKYTISLSRPTTLSFTYIGYIGEKVKVNSDRNLDIELRLSANQLDDVVVVGYGTQRKANLTGAVQNVTSKELVTRSLGSGSQALQGLVPGLTAVVSSGQPGADGATLRIRGYGSLNSDTKPLVLIDGVEGDIDRIDLNTIESISVLKDAASASIYGARASNGVLLITTKRGEEGRPRVSFNGYVGWNKPTALPKPVATWRYLDAINQARVNNNQDIAYSDEVIEMYRNGEVDNMTAYDSDWMGLTMKKSGMIQNYSVSVSGGSKNLNVYASAGYYKQDGIIHNNSFDRMSIKLNTDMKVNDYLKIGVDMNVRQATAQNPAGAGLTEIIGYAMSFNPLLGAVNANGKYGPGYNNINPYAIVYNEQAISKSVAPEYVVMPSFTLTPIKGLTIRGTYSWKRNDSNQSAFNCPYEIYVGDSFQGRNTETTARSESRGTTVKKQYNLLGTYENTFNKQHYLKVMAGFQSEDLAYNYITARRTGFQYDGYNELTNGDPSSATNGSNKYEWAMLSYMARINYSFDNRYLIELNGRYDGTSRFATGHKWGFFPSGSAGWRISQEKFWDDARDVMDNFKVRVSYGLLGNESISGYYPWDAAISATPPTLSDSSWAVPGNSYGFDKGFSAGVAQTSLANSLITWEKSKQFDVGIDYGFFNSRLSGSMDFYVRNISDMLQQFPVPGFVGLTAPWENAGSMRNIGWELSINWADRIGDLNYYVRANLSDVQNKMTNLYGKEYIGTNTITTQGQAYNSWYGYICDGIYQSDEEIIPVFDENGIQLNPVYGNNNAAIHAGYLKYRDVSGPDGVPDGKITEDDRVILGNPTPRYEFALTLGGEWKGFDLQAMFQGVGKRDVFYSGIGARPLTSYGVLYEHQMDTWTENNRDASYPILLEESSSGSPNNPNYQMSSFWVKNGAYCRLKNLVIGYTLPAKITQKAFISKARFYFTAQNLFTIRNNFYKGYDPENSVGTNGTCYPVNKTFLVGVNLEF